MRYIIVRKWHWKLSAGWERKCRLSVTQVPNFPIVCIPWCLMYCDSWQVHTFSCSFQIFKSFSLYFIFQNIKTLPFIPCQNSDSTNPQILATLHAPLALCSVLCSQLGRTVRLFKGIHFFPFPSGLPALSITAFLLSRSPVYLWTTGVISSLSQKFYSTSHWHISLSWNTSLPFLPSCHSLLVLLIFPSLLILLFRCHVLRSVSESWCALGLHVVCLPSLYPLMNILSSKSSNTLTTAESERLRHADGLSSRTLLLMCFLLISIYLSHLYSQRGHYSQHPSPKQNLRLILGFLLPVTPPYSS